MAGDTTFIVFVIGDLALAQEIQSGGASGILAAQVHGGERELALRK